MMRRGTLKNFESYFGVVSNGTPKQHQICHKKTSRKNDTKVRDLEKFQGHPQGDVSDGGVKGVALEKISGSLRWDGGLGLRKGVGLGNISGTLSGVSDMG
jgi:hypothetical protein